ncbi:MAG: lipoyl domain-containing protein [Candidatus Caldarchaeum sp.]|nr:lipoyl domain-containing protein [Candidatus Caldarchaeum sp.]MDW7977881.1 lipoyl domain-containing protein [Candidatus Caldarchaeum sp.]MDW8360019.1 lipoyl domain-containing protein [Candidatus Caldarchaeum sp.]
MPEVYRLILPRIDVAMESGKVAEWLKKEGDSVRKGEVVVVVETEKAAVEIPSEVDGRIVRIVHGVGEEVSVGETLAEIEKA